MYYKTSAQTANNECVQHTLKYYN